MLGPEHGSFVSFDAESLFLVNLLAHSRQLCNCSFALVVHSMVYYKGDLAAAAVRCC